MNTFGKARFNLSHINDAARELAWNALPSFEEALCQTLDEVLEFHEFLSSLDGKYEKTFKESISPNMKTNSIFRNLISDDKSKSETALADLRILLNV